ncbi:sugar transferase [Aquimarina sp. U1-2]|uniref:sugar transferase n=1 Tax=Aquimarina sp. U1-2 TaxID=2823141 RepID=UPI001AEC7A85|nr:sugar transferase [Aquimarina sp. U1-2]MBP2832010.1 sugar transferase [Aquimarina sp. U1-2]
MYKHFIKKWLDVTIALMLFILCSPIVIVLMVLLAVVNKGSPFFFQERPGKHEKIFSIIKFKTMNDKVDEQGRLLPDELRITQIGKLVRKSSLDELPQLINVIKGDMSFIGPRPLLIRYLPFYQGEEKLRHTIAPGITGLAQVSGRNLLNWDDRLSADVVYVKNVSFSLDFTIFLKTIKNVLIGKDIATVSNSILEDFDEYRKGNSLQNPKKSDEDVCKQN